MPVSNTYANNTATVPHILAERFRRLEMLEQVTQIGLASQNVDSFVQGVLDLVLDSFGADRAWFITLCEPETDSWRVVAKRTQEKWPGFFAIGRRWPMDKDMTALFSRHLHNQEVIQYHADSDHPVPPKIAAQFSVKSQVITTLNPEFGRHWLFGFQHCADSIAHDENDLQLFNALANRVSDTLKALVSTEQLRESAAEIQDLYDSAPCGYHSLDKNGIVRQINSTELDWLGYRREEVVDRMKWCEFVESSCTDSYLANLSSLIRNGTIKDVEYVLIRKDGTRFHGLLSATAVVDAHGKFVMSRATLTNIDSLKEAERQLHDLAAHLHDVIEEEKTHISREIHDELGGTMTAIKLEAHSLRNELSVIDHSPTAIERIQTMSRLLDHASASMRKIVTGLRPTMIDDLGLLAALEWKSSQFQQRTGIDCRVNCIANKGNLNKQISTALFRIAQEALTNVVKHSGASRVDIEYLHNDEEVLLSVIDNGRGLSMEESRALSSCGMLGMRERASRHGGKIGFDTPTGGGFIVTVVFPSA
jgi:PAS domain S-box-containing protein